MIPYGKHHIDQEDIDAVTDVMRGVFLTQGPAVEAFESAVAEYVGAKYAVAVSNATSGLHLAAMAAGVGPSNALITSPITFIASANAAHYAGGSALFADIEPDTVNLSVSDLKNVLSDNPHARAVVPVHFAGLPCDMEAIKQVCDEAGVVIIEDAAHALGACYPNGRRVGCCEHSLMTVFSFHPVKAIAAGEGGMIVTNDKAIYRRLLRLRSHGINKLDDQFQLPEQAITNGVQDPWYYEMQELGYHYRITDIQCALALSQLKKIDRFIARRRELVKVYDNAFAGQNHFWPAQQTGRELSGHHLYVIRIDFDAIGMTRGEVMRALRERGIGSQVHYIPVTAQPFYQRLGHKPTDQPEAYRYYQQALSIPLFFDLTDQEQLTIINTIKELLA